MGRLLAGLLATLLLFAPVAPAIAAEETDGLSSLKMPADFPAGIIRIIVPYGSGGGSHQVAVAISEELSKITGREILVLTRPGRSGLDAVDEFMDKQPSALNILQHIDDAASGFAAGRLRYDPTEDWIPLGITQITFSQLYIRSRDPRFHDWTGFLRYAQANPGFVKIGNVGEESSAERVNINLLEHALGIKVAQVAFDRPANRYMSVILGSVDALVEQPGDVRPFLDRELYTPVLTFLKDRPSAFARTPALSDIDARFTPLLRFRGFFVRAGVPEAHARYLEAALAKAYWTDSYQAFNRAAYMHILDSYRDADGARELIEEAIESYREAFKMMGIIN